MIPPTSDGTDPAVRVPAMPRAPRRGRRWRAVVGIVVGLFATAALGGTVAVRLAQSMISDRIERAAEAFGLDVTHRAIEVPLFEGITVRGVEVRADGRLLARLDEVRTDVSLLAAVGGQRRPGAVSIDGGHAVVTWVDGRIAGLDTLLAAPPREPAGDARAAAPINVTIKRLTTTIDARQSGAQAERITVRDIDATLGRDAERRVTATGSARLVAGGRESPMTFGLDAEGAMTARFDGGATIGLATPWGPAWIGIHGLRRDPVAGRTEAERLGLSVGTHRLSVATLTTMDGGGRLPDPRGITSIEATGVVAERGPTRAVAGALSVALKVSEDPTGLPEPTTVTARDAGVVLSGGAIRATLGEADLTLEAPLTALREGRPLDAITRVSLARPRLDAVIGGEADGPGAETFALIEGIMNRATEREPPDPTTPETTPPTGALPDPARTTTARLAATLGDGRLKAVIERLKQWLPQVVDGVVDVRDAEGKPILALARGALETRVVGEGLMEVGIAAHVQRGELDSGSVDADIGLDDDGTVVYVNGKLSGRDLAHQLSRFWDRLTVQPDSEVDLRFNYTHPIDVGAPHTITGDAKLRNFTFEWWRVADAEVRDLEGEIDFDLALFREERRAVLDLTKIRFGEATFDGRFEVAKPVGKKPHFKARLRMPRQDCGAAARSIPKALIPRLSRLELRGKMAFDARLDLDLEQPRELQLDVDGDADACHVIDLGPRIYIESLKRDFVHRPREPERGTLYHVKVGRGTDEWVPSEKLTKLVKDMAWVTEDRKFHDHGGVRWDLVERALRIDLAHERFVYGGSTVTQQLVKNLYLDRGKTLARKLEEAIISWQMERILTKDEILTVYVNVIEYGPDIYGVKHASRYYFNKHQSQLTPLEAAFIMGLKPFPASGHRQWERQQLDKWWIKRMRHVLGMLVKRSDTVTAEQIAEYEAINYQPTFRKPTTPIDPGPPPGRRANPDLEWSPWGEEP